MSLSSSAPSLDPTIFKAYDVRGIVDRTLTEEAVYWIGRALGAEAEARGEQHIYVARDGRLSGPKLIAALTRGLTEAGRDVTDLGMVPTPVLYYAAYELGTGSGIMITGSHNPPEYNGLKMVLGGTTLSGPDIQQLHGLRLRSDCRCGGSIHRTHYQRCKTRQAHEGHHRLR
jgi:phosphomannomutase/phosphoglucomutase